MDFYIESYPFQNFGIHHYKDNEGKQRLRFNAKVQACNGELVDAEVPCIDGETFTILKPSLDFMLPNTDTFIGFRVISTDGGVAYTYKRPPVELTMQELKEIAQEKLKRPVTIKFRGVSRE